MTSTHHLSPPGALLLSTAAPLEATHHAAGQHVSLGSQPEIRLFELTADLAVAETGGADDDVPSASARYVLYRRASNDYTVDVTGGETTLYDVLVRRDVSSEPVGIAPLKSGQRTWAIFNEQSGRWELFHEPTEVYRFQLTESLSPGGSAAALLVGWDAGAGQYALSTVALVVHDVLATTSGEAGTRGYARYFADSDRWEILPRGGESSVIRFELTTTKPLGGAAVARALTWDGSQYVPGDEDLAVLDSVGQWSGDVGYRGWATRRDDRPTHTIGLEDLPAYEVLWMEGLARWIEFALVEAMGAALPGTSRGAAVENYWGGPPGAKPPSANVDVVDRQNLFSLATVGARGLAVLDEIQNEYVVVRCQTKAESITFTLLEDMGSSVGGQASAALNDYYRGTNPGSTITIHDPQGLFPLALEGAKGKATLDDHSDQYHATECQQRATMCIAEIQGEMTSADATHPVDNVVPLNGQSPVALATDTITVRNTFHWDAADNSVCIFVWNQTDQAWDLLQVECT